MMTPEWMHEANLALHRALPYLLMLLSAAAAFELLPGSWRGQAGRLARVWAWPSRRDG